MCGILGIYNLDDKGVMSNFFKLWGKKFPPRSDGEGIHIDEI